MESQVRLVRFNPHHDQKFLDELAECYRTVFGEHPWSEWKKCPVCAKKWGIEEMEELCSVGHSHCGSSVVDFWPTEHVKEDLFSEITPEASCWLAIEQMNGVIGFCWAYPIHANHLEEKLELSGISNLLKDEFGSEKVGYLDEVGLVQRMRGKRIAKKLYRAVIRDIIDGGIGVNVMRTKTNPPTVAFHWFIKDGYQVVAEYNDPDGRVILAKKLSEADKF